MVVLWTREKNAEGGQDVSDGDGAVDLNGIVSVWEEEGRADCAPRGNTLGFTTLYIYVQKRRGVR